MSAPGDRQDKYFPQTSLTLLVNARAADPQARTAQEEFARRYGRPVRDFIVAVTGDRQRAEDWTQDFFADIVVPGRLLANYDPRLGRFRPYLKRAVHNYVVTKLRWEARDKRRPEEELRPDAWSDAGWDRLKLQTDTSPDAAFHQAWVRALLDDALAEVARICEERGQTEHLRLFARRYLSEDADPPSWKELGATVGLDEKTARSRADTVARHLRLVLRQMLRDELQSDQAVDDEIAVLLAFV